MTCPRCKSETELMVNVTMIIPGSLEKKLKKRDIRKKDVRLYAVDWETSTEYCLNKNCSWKYYPYPKVVNKEEK